MQTMTKRQARALRKAKRGGAALQNDGRTLKGYVQDNARRNKLLSVQTRERSVTQAMQPELAAEAPEPKLDPYSAYNPSSMQPLQFQQPVRPLVKNLRLACKLAREGQTSLLGLGPKGGFVLTYSGTTYFTKYIPDTGGTGHALRTHYRSVAALQEAVFPGLQWIRFENVHLTK